MNITFAELTNKAVEAVRTKCGELGITQGAIGVCIEPKAGFTCEWADLPLTASTALYVAPVDINGDTICRKPDGTEIGDAAGVVMMKVCAAKRAMQYASETFEVDGDLLTSGALPEELVGNGRINWDGCIAIPVGYCIGGPCGNMGATCMNLYVAVSGGTQETDKEAAIAGVKYILGVLKENHDRGFIIHRDLWQYIDE